MRRLWSWLLARVRHRRPARVRRLPKDPWLARGVWREDDGDRMVPPGEGPWTRFKREREAERGYYIPRIRF